MSLLAVTSGDIASGVVEAEGIDLDGTYDYLSRSTDLVGNVDSKQFTFSCWVYKSSNNTNTESKIFSSDTGGTFHVNIRGNSLQILGYNLTEDGYVLNLQATSATNIPLDTFSHILVSVDLSNTLNRSIYINDVLAISPNFSTYINAPLNFTCTKYGVGGSTVGSGLTRIRLSHLFLAREYVDLSIESNRRMFITADGKPTPTATLKALNPILYLPMKDSATAHINEGTGGNFTANGTFATSNRGANQDNCVASKFDNSNDYMQSSSGFGATSKTLTFSAIFKANSGICTLLMADNNGAGLNIVSKDLSFILFNSTNTLNAFRFSTSTDIIQINRTYHIVFSLDLTDTNKRKVFLNGEEIAVVWNNYTDTQINLGSSYVRIGLHDSLDYFDGEIGEVYLSNDYIDLATNNPFWDSETNKPIPVRKAMANLGSNPLICMPISADNPGKNYGSGGGFTLNGGGLVGARGASEVWARSAKFDGSTGYLSRGALTGVTNTTSFSCVYATKFDANQDHAIINIFQNDYSNIFEIKATAGGGFYLRSSVASATKLEAFVTTLTPSSISTGVWAVYFFCIDLSDTNKRFVYINNAVQSPNYSTYINSNIMFTSESVRIGRNITTAYSNDSKSLVYLSNQYIDFSQEVNRLKFVDGLGYPLDLKKQIEAGVIPKPLIYLPFDDPTNLGKNLGTGGEFSVIGTVTQGSDVLG